MPLPYNECCVDGSVSIPMKGIWAFVPIEHTSETSFNAVVGLTVLSDKPPEGWKLVGVINYENFGEDEWTKLEMLAAECGVENMWESEQ